MTLQTLSYSGAIKTPELLANQLLLYFYVSEEAQTYFYTGMVSSMKYLISISDDISDISSNIKNGLEVFYSNYFTDVNVELELKSIEDDSQLLELNVNISIIDKGRLIVVSNKFVINRDVGSISIDLQDELYKGK